MCEFACGTMPYVKSLLHWSVIRYQSDILGVVPKPLLN